MVVNQVYVFCSFIIIGIVIGIIFDVFRISRKSFITSDIFTYIEDISFYVISFFIIMYSIFKLNNGEIRLYIFLGIIIGLIFHLLIFSRHFIKISVLIINILKKYIKILINIILFPFKSIIKITYKPIRFFVFNLRKFNKKIIPKSIKNNILRFNINKFLKK